MSMTAPQRIGTAAEHLVIYELLRRGFEVSVPVVDMGIDLLVDYESKIQVKAASPSNLGRAFNFNLGRRRPGQEHRLNLHADFYIFAGLVPNGNRFWIIPTMTLGAFKDKASISIPTNPHSNRSKTHRYTSLWGYEDAWEILRASQVRFTERAFD